MDRRLKIYNALIEAGASLYAWNMEGYKATTVELNGKYAVFLDVNKISGIAEETVILYHEGGHLSTGATHIVNSPLDLIEKHENKADKWAVQASVSPEDIDDAIADGCTEWWQLAEHLGVTEDFAKKAVCYYTYGNLATRLYF